MAIEIERKFLIKDDSWRAPDLKGTPYRQGYIGQDTSHAVRVRIAGDKAFLTIKSGPLSSDARSRYEFEYSIPLADAQTMLKEVCDPGQIHKIRYRLSHKGLVWEVDEFLQENAGLTLVEVELGQSNQKISLPEWVGQEVTQDSRYTNAALARRPFTTWKSKDACVPHYS